MRVFCCICCLVVSAYSVDTCYANYSWVLYTSLREIRLPFSCIFHVRVPSEVAEATSTKNHKQSQKLAEHLTESENDGYIVLYKFTFYLLTYLLTYLLLCTFFHLFSNFQRIIFCVYYFTNFQSLAELLLLLLQCCTCRCWLFNEQKIMDTGKFL